MQERMHSPLTFEIIKCYRFLHFNNFVEMHLFSAVKCHREMLISHTFNREMGDLACWGIVPGTLNGLC